MAKALRSCGILLLLLLASGRPLAAQGQREMVDFADDHTPIPEAAGFDQAQFQASGAEAAFAADKKVYEAGQFPQAAQRLAQTLQLYPYKSALWVYLARAYSQAGDLELAKQTLAQAGVAMPDLQPRFWNPLSESMLDEVRRRAFQLQNQLDFYPERQTDFVPLLRLYRFLEDGPRALGVVRAAEGRERQLYQEAEVASGAERQSYLAAAAQWGHLALSLRAELDSGATGAAPAGEAGVADTLQREATKADSLQEAETIRLLRLRVDFYLAKPQEYQTLFDQYLRLGRRTEAGQVVEALERESQRFTLLASLAANAVDADKYQEQAKVLGDLRQQLQAQLVAGSGP